MNEDRSSDCEIPGRTDLDREALRAQAHAAVDWMVDYLTSPGGEPILSPRAPRDVFDDFQDPLPSEGASLEAVLEEFRAKVVPAATDLQHPGNMAYIPNSTGVVGIIADILAATLNQNVSLVRGGPSAAAVEAQVVGWLQSLLGYPREGGGVLASGGSIANLMGLALARHRAGAGDNGVVYLSEETHSSIERALRFLGLPPESMRRVAIDASFRMRPDALEEVIVSDRASGRRPIAVVATAGTIGSGAVDPLDELADLCERENVWLHVDGAYGVLAAAAPSASWMRSGLARVDSLSLDPHKWLFVPIYTSCLLVKDVAAMRRFFTVVPEYLKVNPAEQAGEVHQPMEHTVELSRRFRALRIWMVVKTYGADAIREKIEEHLRLARELASWIEASERFELSAPVMTSTVCFRYLPDGSTSDEDLDEINEAIMNRLNRRDGIFLSRNRLRGRFTLRACITHLRTTEADVRRLWEACQEEAAAVTT